MKLKLTPAFLSVIGIFLLGSSCAQPKNGVGDPDVAASKQEAQRDFEKKWNAEQKRQQRLAEDEAAAKRRYYDEYIRQHGYPTHEDRQRAIRDALRSSGR